MNLNTISFALVGKANKTLMVGVPQHVFMWVLRILNFHELISSNTFGGNERVLLGGGGGC